MQSVITAAEAKKITRGRTPLVPVEYETACTALAACLTLDEAKYWDNTADALAAWAKIHHDDKIGRKARALKLWAFRRMGELAAELRPIDPKRQRGSQPGPRMLLMEQGLKEHEAAACRALARADEKEVKRLTSLPRPPTPASACNNYPSAGRLQKTASKGSNSRAASADQNWRRIWPEMVTVINLCGATDAVSLGRSISLHASDHIRERILILTDWLDAFEQALPTVKE